jgi:hypothetical protein
MISEYRDRRLDTANQVLSVAFAVMLAYTVFQISRQSAGDFHFPYLPGDVSEKKPVAQAGVFPAEAKPFDEYADVFAKRDLFSPAGMDVAEEPAAEIRTKAGIDDLMRNLKVVGIVFSGRPQVIIEDAGSRETFFLYQDDAVRGATVKDIREGGATLLYENQEIELKP